MSKVVFLMLVPLLGCVSLSKYQNLQSRYSIDQSKHENDKNKYEQKLNVLERAVETKNHTIVKLQQQYTKPPAKEDFKPPEIQYTLKKICVLFEEDMGESNKKHKSEQSCYDIVVTTTTNSEKDHEL